MALRVPRQLWIRAVLGQGSTWPRCGVSIHTGGHEAGCWIERGQAAASQGVCGTSRFALPAARTRRRNRAAPHPRHVRRGDLKLKLLQSSRRVPEDPALDLHWDPLPRDGAPATPPLPDRAVGLPPAPGLSREPAGQLRFAGRSNNTCFGSVWHVWGLRACLIKLQPQEPCRSRLAPRLHAAHGAVRPIAAPPGRRRSPRIASLVRRRGAAQEAGWHPRPHACKMPWGRAAHAPALSAAAWGRLWGKSAEDGEALLGLLLICSSCHFN